MELNTRKGDVEEARKVPIVGLLNLRRTGRIVHSKCPFHADNTPSFAVYPDNTYHCFGCGKHGNNAIDFVMTLMEIPFKEAVSELMSYRYPQS